MTHTPTRADRIRQFRNALGLVILGVAFAWSCVYVSDRTFGPGDEDSAAGKKVIRFVHWQLEGGVVKAYDEACREYMRLNPDVIVEQIDVHERAYTQWVQTQLIGRTAPDLIELRFQGNLIVRYFVPLSEIADRPNPYNKGTDLEGVPWRDTYIDGMIGGYILDLQDYYGIPTSVFTVRCYANAKILKEAAGVTEPPKTLGEFFRICEAIQDYARKNHLPLVPIAGSKYTEEMFRGKYWDMATFDLLDKQDLDSDGGVLNGERIHAIYTGKIDLETDPCVEAAHKVLFDICRYFNPGFMAGNRDQSVFLFAQGNAAMIATGTWDAGSLWQQVEGEFPIMVFDFPVPAPDERYGQIIRSRVSEAATVTQGLFGLSKFSRHPETAIDFMHYLTSQKVNEEINRKWRWFPAIRGAKTDKILQAFEPQVEGVYNVFHVGKYFGPETELRYLQQYTDYISTVPQQGVPYDQFLDEHYQKFIKQFARDYKAYALKDFVTVYENSYTAGVQSEVAIAQVRARAMREGLTPDIRRNLVALILGQARRMETRAYEWQLYEEAKAAYEGRKAGSP